MEGGRVCGLPPLHQGSPIGRTRVAHGLETGAPLSSELGAREVTAGSPDSPDVRPLDVGNEEGDPSGEEEASERRCASRSRRQL